MQRKHNELIPTNVRIGASHDLFFGGATLIDARVYSQHIRANWN